MKRKDRKSKAVAARRIRLFKNGRSQAIRIPREWELPGDEAMVIKEGERLILSPAPKRDLLTVLRSLPPLGPDDQFPEIDDPPPAPVTVFDDRRQRPAKTATRRPGKRHR